MVRVGALVCPGRRLVGSGHPPMSVLWSPSWDAGACGKIGCGLSPRSIILGAGEPEYRFDPGSRWWGRVVAMTTRVHLLSVPVRFLRAAAFMQSVLWERFSSSMGRRCRTVRGTGRGAGSRQGRSRGVCAGAAPTSGPVGECRSCAVTARPPHVVGDGGLVAALARAAGGDGIHLHLLEGRVLTCRSRVL